jgi:hypothetical protein
MTEKAFYLFPWPSYYCARTLADLNADEKIRNLDGLLQRVDLTKRPFYEIQDYIRLFEEDQTINEAMRSGFTSLPEIYAKCQTAKVIVCLNSPDSNI